MGQPRGADIRSVKKRRGKKKKQKKEEEKRNPQNREDHRGMPMGMEEILTKREAKMKGGKGKKKSPSGSKDHYGRGGGVTTII